MYTKQADKLVETIEMPVLETAFSRKEIENNLQWSKDRRDVKVMELAGAEQEVARFEIMLVEADKLGVVAEKVAAELTSIIP